MRHRIEDLGRLSVLLNTLLDHQLFDESRLPRRNKDYDEWWAAKTEDQKDDALREFIYGIDDVRERLLEMLLIANGQDECNE